MFLKVRIQTLQKVCQIVGRWYRKNIIDCAVLFGFGRYRVTFGSCTHVKRKKARSPGSPSPCARGRQPSFFTPSRTKFLELKMTTDELLLICCLIDALCIITRNVD